MPDTPFPTVSKLESQLSSKWQGIEYAIRQTELAEEKLINAFSSIRDPDRFLGSDVSLVLFGSFARYEFLPDSDYDWSLLIDGVVNSQHARLSRDIGHAMENAKLIAPGASGTFGNMVFSHDLVHRIGGGADSNANLTRRMLMLLESRPYLRLSPGEEDIVWKNVLANILRRYFEEDVHFAATSARTVPRFLMNDLTRYWRTIAVDYAAKHQEQGESKWALRNAKLRFSRKLLYACGLAFCFRCELNPTEKCLFGPDETPVPFIKLAEQFASTPSLEYLARFVDDFIDDPAKKTRISEAVFGSYSNWLELLGDPDKRKHLSQISHAMADKDPTFQQIRDLSLEFARGMELLFFGRNRDEEQDKIAKLSLEYIGF